jgi:hypothetical protein
MARVKGMMRGIGRMNTELGEILSRVQDIKIEFF